MKKPSKVTESDAKEPEVLESSEPEEIKPPKAEEPPKASEPQGMRIKARQFAMTTKTPPRTWGGFLNYCERLHPNKKYPATQWQTIWDEFQNKPVK